MSIDGTVIKVHDGDTLTVHVEVDFNLRLKKLDGTGCYAPETYGVEKPYGAASREHLVSLALGKKVRVFIPTEGLRTLGDISSLGRILGNAWVIDGPKESLADLQLQSGNALPKKRKKSP